MSLHPRVLEVVHQCHDSWQRLCMLLLLQQKAGWRQRRVALDEGGVLSGP